MALGSTACPPPVSLTHAPSKVLLFSRCWQAHQGVILLPPGAISKPLQRPPSPSQQLITLALSYIFRRPHGGSRNRSEERNNITSETSRRSSWAGGVGQGPVGAEHGPPSPVWAPVPPARPPRSHTPMGSSASVLPQVFPWGSPAP